MHILEEISLKEAELIGAFVEESSVKEILTQMLFLVEDNKEELYCNNREVYDIYTRLFEILKSVHLCLEKESYEHVFNMKYNYFFKVLSEFEEAVGCRLEKENLVKFFIYNLTSRRQSKILFEDKIEFLETINFSDDEYSVNHKKDLLAHLVFLLVKQVPLNIEKVVKYKNELKKII